jgi:hypothetical protein
LRFGIVFLASPSEPEIYIIVFVLTITHFVCLDLVIVIVVSLLTEMFIASFSLTCNVDVDALLMLSSSILAFFLIKNFSMGKIKKENGSNCKITTHKHYNNS